MKIHCLNNTPAPPLALALAEFEKEFRYPLGPEDSFSISHGADYSLFFRSMGATRIYLAESEGEIVGALTLIGRQIALADGRFIRAAYLCDAKIVSQQRGKTVLARLAISAHEDAHSLGYEAAYSVVMSGSDSIPSDRYTGRLGIPRFEELGKIAILRFDTQAHFDGILEISCLKKCHRPISAELALSSEMIPEKIEIVGASGILTDTRRGKRLWKSDGTEMRSGHLAEIEFTSTAALSKLTATALKKAAALGFPGLFLALPKSAMPAISGAVTLAEATIFGTGLPTGDWIVNTSEI